MVKNQIASKGNDDDQQSKKKTHTHQALAHNQKSKSRAPNVTRPPRPAVVLLLHYR